MNLRKLVWRNLLRRRGRFLFTLAGVAIGMAAFVALQTIGQGLTREIKRQAQGLGANLVVTPKGWCAYEQISVLTGEQLPEAIDLADLDKIKRLAGVKTAVPYLNEKTAFRNRPVPLIGILPQEMQTLQKWHIRTGRYFESADDRAIVVGFAIAKQFDLRVGDDFTVRGKTLPVIGILDETGTKDDIASFTPLTVAQEIYSVHGKVSFIAVEVENLEHVDAVSLRIQEVANVAVVTDKQLLASVLSIVGTVSAAMTTISAVGLLSAAFGIVNTLLSAVYERRHEIGILQAIGGRRRVIFFSFMLESGLYGLLGGLIGILIGMAAAFVLGPYITSNALTAALPQTASPMLDMTTVATTLALSIGLALVAGLYPAMRAAKLTPMEAIRHV